MPATERDTVLRRIATDYAASSDLAQAQAALDELDLANPAQVLVSMAEADVRAGKPAEEIVPVARLAEALGARSPKLVAHFAPTPEPSPTSPPTATAVPPSPMPAPTETPAQAPTAVPATATPEPATPAPTATAQTPRVLTSSNVNLRSGPGRAYPVIGQLRGGQETAILARNASGDWWQLAWDGQGQAWVAGTVVNVLGAIDTVAVAQNIPTPPPQPTTTPRPTAAPTQPPKPGMEFTVESVRLRPLNVGAQRCDGGDHNIFITVLDPAGNPLNGVRILEVFTGQIRVTGEQGKGDGRAEYDLYRGGGGQLRIVDEANNPKSELTRGMSNTFPDFDLMKAAGYCTCKPHPDDASCEADINSQQYLFAWGHYVYEVVFRRVY